MGRNRWRALAIEAIGLALALVLIAIALMHLATNDRSWILYYDGDSMQLPILLASLREGAAQSWILSSVLFIPEAGLYLLIGALGLGVKATITIYALVILVFVYVGFRAIAWASTVSPRTRQVAGALLAMAIVVLWMLTESDSDRYSLQVVSLIASTGYYASSIIGMLLCLAFIARVVRAPYLTPGWWLSLVAAAIVVAGSVLNNPLFIVWFCAPTGVVLVVVAALRLARIRMVTIAAIVIVVASVGGMYGRKPFAGLIGQSGLTYIHPELAGIARATLRTAVVTRLSTPAGVLCAILLVIAISIAVGTIVSGIRRREAVKVLIGLFPIVSAVALVVGSLSLGLSSWRYFMPVFFGFAGPFIFLASTKRRARLPQSIRARRSLVAIVGVSALLVTFVTVAETSATRTPTIAKAETSVECVAAWIDDHDTHVLGEFWTSRAAKAYSQHPSRVIQVLPTLMRWRWLVNLNDFTGVDSVPYVISEPGDQPIIERAKRTSTLVGAVDCGSYDISQYSPALVPNETG